MFEIVAFASGVSLIPFVLFCHSHVSRCHSRVVSSDLYGGRSLQGYTSVLSSLFSSFSLFPTRCDFEGVVEMPKGASNVFPSEFTCSLILLFSILISICRITNIFGILGTGVSESDKALALASYIGHHGVC